MISSLTWIPRGAARSHPVKFELSPEELENIKNLAEKERIIEYNNENNKNIAEIEYSNSSSKFNNNNEDSDGDEDETDENNDQIIDDGNDDTNVNNIELPTELYMENYDEEDDGPIDNDILNVNEFDTDAFDLMEHGNSAFANELDFDSEDEDAEVKKKIFNAYFNFLK